MEPWEGLSFTFSIACIVQKNGHKSCKPLNYTDMYNEQVME